MALDERYSELIQKELDGELSEAESAELKEVLATNEAARNLREELGVVEKNLQSLKLFPPPGGVTEQLLSTWTPRPAPAPSAVPTARPGRWWPYAYSVAAGLVLGFFLTPLLYPPESGSVDPSSFQGTMMRPPETAQVLEVKRLQLDGIQATARLRRAGRSVILSLELPGEPLNRVRVGYEASRLVYSGVSHSHRQPIEIVRSASVLEIKEISGPVHFYFEQTVGDGTTIDVSVEPEGRAPAQASFELTAIERVGQKTNLSKPGLYFEVKLGKSPPSTMPGGGLRGLLTKGRSS